MGQNLEKNGEKSASSFIPGPVGDLPLPRVLGLVGRRGGSDGLGTWGLSVARVFGEENPKLKWMMLWGLAL